MDRTIVAPLVKEIESFVMKYGINRGETLSALLDYIISYFDPEGHPVDGWKYNIEQNACFYNMMSKYFNVMQEGLKRNGWYDAFGDIFMEWAGSKNTLGQCFTPAAVCDMISEITFSDTKPEKNSRTIFGNRVTISDCACGSGRLLLAAAAKLEKLHADKPYLVAEDIDSMCCKQTAVNMMIHGCFGEVVCHNTLCEPDTVRFGYIINEGMWPLSPGIPTIRRFTDTNRFYAIHIWRQRKNAKEAPKFEPSEVIESVPSEPVKQEAVETPKGKKHVNEPIQLSLW